MTPSDTPPVGGGWVLRPCPFCGGPAREPIQYNGALETGCAGSFECAGTDVLVPVQAWNRRTAPPPPVRDREAVAQIIERNTRRGRNGAYITDIPKLADAILRLLGLSPSLSPGELELADPLPPERCVCGCSSFARMDEEAPGGGYRKGRQFRCVHCKREHDERRDATATEAGRKSEGSA